MSEPCSCPLAGHCERHQISKPSHWHKLCQTKEKYRQAWDEMRGPGQAVPQAEREAKIAKRAKRIAKREEQGRKAWSALHGYSPGQWDAAEAERWYAEWLYMVPGYGCSCRDEWAKLTAESPPDFTSRDAFRQWAIDRHNDVNRRLGKPEW